jgi:hypothetical protein
MDYHSPPQPIKAADVGGGIADGVLDVPVAKIVLDETSIGALSASA